jgi:Rieske Fe-S protein
MAAERDNARVLWTRRLFVQDSVLGWLGLVIGPAAYSWLRRYDYTSTAQAEGSKELGTVSDFTPGQAKEVTLAGRKVLVGRLNTGEWTAVSAVCTPGLLGAARSGWRRGCLRV